MDLFQVLSQSDFVKLYLCDLYQAPPM